jgi:hypothetical protein
VLANGAQARTAPHPGMDPGFLPGNPLGGVISGPRDGLVPRWASYGEARLWYALPE